MKKTLSIFFKCILAGSLAVIILSAVCFIYSYGPIGIEDSTNSTTKKNYPCSYSANMTEGFAWKKTDENGYYNESAELAIDPEILIIGSSHIEALQVPTENSVASLLNKKYKTYSLGVSGQFIDSCIQRISFAVDEYKPSKYVILETDGSPLSLEDMENAINHFGEPNNNIPVYSRLSGYKRDIYKFIRTYIPSAMEIMNKVNNWKTMDIRGGGKSSDEAFIFSAEYESALNKFIELASKPVNNSGAKLIIVSRLGGEIDSKGNYIISDYNKDYSNGLKEACRQNDVILLDVSNNFKELYEREHVLPYGFTNTAIGTGHLNKYGHKVIADAILGYIENNL